MVTELPAGFYIRRATPDDASLLVDLTLRCWTGSVAGNSTAFNETIETVVDQLLHGGAAIVSAGETPVGSGRFYPVSGPPGDPRKWIEIKRVGILKSHRKLGLAGPLVAVLESEARSRGYAGAQLGVRHDQPRLVAFWESVGYRLANDVTLHTPNPLTPPPTFMRKAFQLPSS
ncbi:MAG: GNAT family N-acetyltransferase [Burkholderiales bacterium]|nr:MAG: GNAT family N-acetyltransferase [Burkholderiales bacterium]